MMVKKVTGFAFAPDTSTHETLSHSFSNQNNNERNRTSKRSFLKFFFVFKKYFLVR